MANSNFARFDWYCPHCQIGYYSNEVERSDKQGNPLCSECNQRLHNPTAKYQHWDPPWASAGWRPED